MVSERWTAGLLFRTFMAICLLGCSSLVRAEDWTSQSIRDLKNPDATVRARAAKTLGSSTESATVEPLAAALVDQDQKVREHASAALSHMASNANLVIQSEVGPDEMNEANAILNAIRKHRKELEDVLAQIDETMRDYYAGDLLTAKIISQEDLEKIRQAGSQQKQKADAESDTAIPSSPSQQSQGRDHRKTTAKSGGSGRIICNGSAVEGADYRDWRKAGFKKDEICDWFGNPWCTACDKPDEAQAWKANSFSSLEYATGMNAGIPLENAILWKKEGIPLGAAKIYRDFGFDRPSEKLNRVGQQCPNNLEESEVLAKANPYDVKGRCFTFVGGMTQILSRTTVLATAMGMPVLLDFGDQSAPGHGLVWGIVKGAGAFEYTTALGVKKIVPSLKLIAIGKEQ